MRYTLRLQGRASLVCMHTKPAKKHTHTHVLDKVAQLHELQPHVPWLVTGDAFCSSQPKKNSKAKQQLGAMPRDEMQSRDQHTGRSSWRLPRRHRRPTRRGDGGEVCGLHSTVSSPPQVCFCVRFLSKNKTKRSKITSHGGRHTWKKDAAIKSRD